MYCNQRDHDLAECRREEDSDKAKAFSTPCQHLTGYWINNGTNFRCYECGSQIWLGNLSEREQRNPKREIEVWIERERS